MFNIFWVKYSDGDADFDPEKENSWVRLRDYAYVSTLSCSQGFIH